MLKNGLCSLTGPGFPCHWSSLWTDNICPKAILPHLPIILEQSLRTQPGNCFVLNETFFFPSVLWREDWLQRVLSQACVYPTNQMPSHLNVPLGNHWFWSWICKVDKTLSIQFRVRHEWAKIFSYSEKWGLQRNRGHTSVDSHKPLKNRIPVFDLSGVGFTVVSYFCSDIESESSLKLDSSLHMAYWQLTTTLLIITYGHLQLTAVNQASSHTLLHNHMASQRVGWDPRPTCHWSA